MKISASIKNNFNHPKVVLQTDEMAKSMEIALKPAGCGSSINGGEQLLLSLATCFCNDIYREEGKRNIAISGVKVVFTGEFDAEGELGANITNSANVISDAPASKIKELITCTDQIA